MEPDYALKIMSSNLLTGEDLDYLTFNYPQVHSTPHHNSNTTTIKSLLQKNYLFLHYCIVIIAILLVAINFNLQSWILILILVPVTFLTLQFIQAKIAAAKRKKLHHTNVRSIDEFVHANEKFQKIMQKCIRFIQEMEIASMGYTLISGKTAIHRLERNTQRMFRECIQLRYQVLKSSVDFILRYRKATLDPTYSCDPSENANFSLKICQIPIEELGPCFVENISSSDLADSTDNFCLDILRDTYQFLIQQRSEFLKLFASTFLSNKGQFKRFQIEKLKENRTACDDATKNLSDLYNLHLTAQTNFNDDSKFKKMSVVATHTPLYTAVHSIQVHLRAALHVAIDSEKSLQEDNGSEGSPVLKDGLLHQLQIHLDACDQCLDETYRCLKLNSEENKEKIPDLDIIKPKNCADVKCSQVDSSLLDVIDDFTEDQIFEGLPDDINEVEREFDNEPEFQSNRKKRIEETVHVMRELKSVLDVKTSAQEREVRKSKLFPKYVPKVIQPQKHIIIDSNCTNLSPLTLKQQVSNFQSNMSAVVTETNNDNHKTNSQNNFISEGDFPETAHKILSLPRRPPPPGKTNRRPSKLRHGRNLETSTEEENGDNGSVSLAFGFPSLLASEAVKVALAARRPGVGIGLCDLTKPGIGLVGKETTFGESDSDS